jgi:ribonuclease HI
MKKPKPSAELYTDGACLGNPGPGGWAYILKDPRTGRDRERSGGEPSTTNNRMELISVIEGLVALDQPSRVELYSDSQYVCKGLSEWLDRWKANRWRRGRNEKVKNMDLWKRLDELRQIHDLSCHWIRGHDDHAENERCDRLAFAAAERFSP